MMQNSHSHPVHQKHLGRKKALDDKNEEENLQGKMGAAEDGNFRVKRTKITHIKNWSLP